MASQIDQTTWIESKSTCKINAVILIAVDWETTIEIESGKAGTVHQILSIKIENKLKAGNVAFQNKLLLRTDTVRFVNATNKNYNFIPLTILSLLHYDTRVKS